MKIHVSGSRTVKQIQHDFSAKFPLLKLVFFTKGHDAYKGTHSKFLIDNTDETINHITKLSHDGDLYIEADMPVWQVERLFEQEFGLHVQVFRKSGSQWLETSVSDDLTLETQNAKAKSQEEYETPISEPMDYREQD